LTLDSLSEGIDAVIVDDGSDIKLCEVINKKNYNYDIHIITLKQNSGIEYALNTGLEYIYNTYNYIARIDCGDISYPGRVEKQIKVLESDPGLVLLGAWAEFVDTDYNTIFFGELPTEHAVIKNKMFLNNMFVHPSVMMRTKAVQMVGGYPTNRKAAEDYALFFKLLSIGKGENLSEPLIKYVVSDKSISSRNRATQIINRLKVIWDNRKINIYFLYGVFRSLLLLLTPRKTITYLRKFIKVY
jgi:glycosyltransferase involved in cell wall biosynthesis